MVWIGIYDRGLYNLDTIARYPIKVGIDVYGTFNRIAFINSIRNRILLLTLINYISNKSTLFEFINAAVGKVQFLINFLLNAKKMGQKSYEMKRRDRRIDGINSKIKYNNANSNYKLSIETLMEINNKNNFIKPLILQPNAVLSIIGLFSNQRVFSLL